MSHSNLFYDNIFPADASSLSYDPDQPAEFASKVASWRRPSEWTREATIFLNDANPGDIEQGQLGDCWLLSAMATVALYPDLLKKLFVSVDQQAGKYIIRLYNNHKWEEVTIDDRIPCDSRGLPVFGHCMDKREIWVVLIEKAMAKLLGSYQALDGGYAEEGVVYLTGGRPERIYVNNWKQKPGKMQISKESLWEKLVRYNQESIMMGAAICSGKEKADETSGIVAGHAYGILDVRETNDKKHKLVKLRNPWGCFEWKGAWSDSSRNWTQEYRKELNHKSSDDGVFWMSFLDFCKTFDKLSMCRIFNDALLSLPHAKSIPLSGTLNFPTAKWYRDKIAGEWNDQNAGGMVQHAAYASNPHLKLTVQKPGRYFIIILRDQLDQNADALYYRSSIGFSIQVGAKSRELMRAPNQNGDKDTIVQYPVCGRYNSLEIELEPGEYTITPHTFYSNRKGKFELEVYGNQPFKLEPLIPDDTAVAKVPPSARGFRSDDVPVSQQPSLDGPQRSSPRQFFTAADGSRSPFMARTATSPFNSSLGVTKSAGGATSKGPSAHFQTTYSMEFSRKTRFF